METPLPSAETETAASSRYRLVTTILILTAARVMVNVARRFTYPFVPQISRDLNVPQTSVQGVIGLQAGIGLTSPAFGPFIQRSGRKRMMLGMLALMAAASGVGALVTQFGVFVGIMLVLGFGKIIYDSAMIGYIGDRVPYHRRGTALGVAELAWAGSFIVSALVISRLLEAGALRLVLTVFCATFSLAFAAIFVAVPADSPKAEATAQVPSLIAAFGILRRHPAALAAFAYSVGSAIANELIFINYGSFMETSFGLSLVALGAATAVIPLAEACGEFLVIGLADRVGKRRLALMGAVLSSLMYVLLPHLTSSLGIAQAALFLMFFGAETGIVASIPLFSEILPSSRSVMMSTLIGGASLGRLVGSVLGGGIYSITGNFALLGVLSLVIGLGSAALLWRFVAEHPSIENVSPSESA